MVRRPKTALVVFVVALAMLVSGCAGDEPGSGSVSPPATTSPTVAQEPSSTPTASPTPTATTKPDSSPTPTAEPSPEPTPSAPPPTPASTPTPTPEPAPRQAQLAFSGDLLSHTSVFRKAETYGGDDLVFDYRPMFTMVRDTLSGADLAICHLETPLSRTNENLSGYPVFNAPGDLAAGIADVGYDGCSTASNHSLDKGIAGIEATLDLFDEAGLGHAGMARTETEAATPRLYEVNGITIGHLSFTYGLNGFVLPADRQWAVDLNDAEDILAEARAAIDQGAEFVVLSIHWGSEYRVAPTSQQRALAKELLAGDEIDLIVGTHAHVIQPVEFVGGNIVIYGLGNFLSNQSPQSCRSCPAESTDGVIMRIDLIEYGEGEIAVSGIGAVPTWVDRRTFTILDVGAALADDSFPELTGELERSWARTTTTLRSYGVDVVVGEG